MITFRTKVVAATACAALVASVAGVASIMYLITTKEATLETQLRARAEHMATDQRLAGLLARIEETRTQRTALTEYMITEDTVVDFLTLIETLAAEQGVSIETRALAVRSIEGSDTFEHLTLEAHVTGSFDAVTRMLALYEVMPYQVTVRNASIMRAEGEARAGLWEGVYTLYVTKYK